MKMCIYVCMWSRDFNLVDFEKMEARTSGEIFRRARDEIARLTSSNMTNGGYVFFYGIKFIEMAQGINGNFCVERILLHYLPPLSGSIVISSELVSVDFKIVETAFYVIMRRAKLFISFLLFSLLFLPSPISISVQFANKLNERIFQK